MIILFDIEVMWLSLHKGYNLSGMQQGEGQGGQLPPPPDFGRSVNPISTRGADYAHHSTTCPPGFLALAAPLLLIGELENSIFDLTNGIINEY